MAILMILSHVMIGGKKIQFLIRIIEIFKIKTTKKIPIFTSIDILSHTKMSFRRKEMMNKP
uniref:CSON013253 protein n=1 Tax=Culicoides sonorensis TaxID=179676 RepID=A0A336M7E9_CULSO